MASQERSDLGPAAYEVVGVGRDALLLPALSSISTRTEMRPLANTLADGLRCVMPDWPGFGAQPRGTGDLSPETLRRFLDTFLSTVITPPAVGIAAGHAAPYLVEAAHRRPECFRQLVLIAPTWRGPLPTMLGDARRPLCQRIRRTIELRGVGELLYRVNVSRPVMARMMRSHVYADPDSVSADRMAAKLAVTRQPRARFATAAFISGGLDPVTSREAFLALFSGKLPPVLMLRPENAPLRSGAEMDALAATGAVTVQRIPGALAAHEERPAETGAAIRRVILESR